MAKQIKCDSARINQQGIFFPIALWQNNEISIIEKIIIMQIQRDNCIRNFDLARLCQSSESLMTKSIKRLIEKGIIDSVGKAEERILKVSTAFIGRILKESGFSGVWMPLSIWNTALISPILKFLIIEVLNLDHGDGCQENNDYFAQFLQVSSTQASRLISQLVQLKLAETITIRAGRKIHLNEDIRDMMNIDIETALQHIKPKPSTISSAKLNNVFDNLFQNFWESYPNKKLGDLKAREKYHQVLKQGVAHDQIMQKLNVSMLSSHWSCGRVPLASAWLSQEFL